MTFLSDPNSKKYIFKFQKFIVKETKGIFDVFLRRGADYTRTSFRNNVSTRVTTIKANLSKNLIKTVSKQPKDKNPRKKRNVPEIDFALVRHDMTINGCFIFKNELVKVRIEGPAIAEEGDLILKIFFVGLDIWTDEWISITHEEVISIKGSYIITLPDDYIWITNSKKSEINSIQITGQKYLWLKLAVIGSLGHETLIVTLKNNI